MNRFFTKKYFLILSFTLVILVFITVTFFYQRPVSQVGSWKIYERDVKYRDSVIQIGFPEEKRSLGQMQLEKSAINLQILKNNGYNISDQQIDDEIKRIDQHTKNPEELAKIKQVFKNDPDSYRRDFILPLLADKIIYSEFFLNNEQIHKESLALATDFLALVKDHPENFRRIAQEKKIKLMDLTVSMIEGLSWTDPSAPLQKSDKVSNTLPMPLPMKVEQANNKNQALFDRIKTDFNKPTELGHNPEAEQWLTNVISTLTAGQVMPVPLNRDDAWLVVRLVKQVSKTIYKLEVAVFQKQDYGKWLEQEKAKIQVEH